MLRAPKPSVTVLGSQYVPGVSCAHVWVHAAGLAVLAADPRERCARCDARCIRGPAGEIVVYHGANPEIWDPEARRRRAAATKAA